jgi:ADP-ribose pyrophosphatase YjhB (NUDIX family)
MGTLPLHSVAVAGVVFRDDGQQVLVIRRRDNGCWEAPGGVLEHGESFEAGLRREVLEESGVTVDVKRLSGVYKNLRRNIVCIVFECAEISGSASSTAEASESCWLPVDQALSRMSEVHAVRISDALTGSPHSRMHDGTHILLDVLEDRPFDCLDPDPSIVGASRLRAAGTVGGLG